jgi:hypothetical protein
MKRKVMSGLAALVLTGVTMAGCTSDRVPGCEPPANEGGLLDEFVKEPVLTVAPEGSKRREAPKRVEACHRLGEHATETAVAVIYDVPRGLLPGEVRSLYEPVAMNSGWTPVPTIAGQLVLRYCRKVAGQAGLLEVTWQDAFQPPGGQLVSGVVTVLLRPADENAFTQAAEAEAARKGGCRQ